jgi:hypothetical protein
MVNDIEAVTKWAGPSWSTVERPARNSHQHGKGHGDGGYCQRDGGT